MKQIIKHKGYFINEQGKVFHNNEVKNTSYSNCGYEQITIEGKCLLIHRLVAETYLSNTNNLNEVNHINGIKSDNNVSNLEWCTRSQNIKHAYDHGLKISTDKHKAAVKLSNTISKSKRVIDLNTGIIYSSRNEAALQLGFKAPYLSMMLNGKRKNNTSLKYE